MTRERIEDMREVVLPFVKKRLLETNYENLGESDAEEFAKEFNEILNLAIEALEQESTTRNCFGCKYSKDNHNAGTEECHLCMWENQYIPTTKNDLGVDSTPNTISFKEMMDNLKITAEDIENAEDLEYSIEPLIRPKNDLVVDCVSRKAVINQIFYSTDNNGDVVLGSALRERIEKLPSITPTSRESVDCIDRQATLDANVGEFT